MSPNTCKAVIEAAAAKTVREAQFAFHRVVWNEFLGSADGNVRVVIEIRDPYSEKKRIEATVGLGAAILAPEKAAEVAQELQRAILLATLINAHTADRTWE